MCRACTTYLFLLIREIFRESAAKSLSFFFSLTTTAEVKGALVRFLSFERAEDHVDDFIPFNFGSIVC